MWKDEPKRKILPSLTGQVHRFNELLIQEEEEEEDLERWNRVTKWFNELLIQQEEEEEEDLERGRKAGALLRRVK